MPTTRFEFTGKSDTLEAAYLNDCRLLFLEPEEQTSLKVQGQGLLFVLNGSGEMRTTYEQKQRQSTLEKQQLFSLQPGTEVRLQGGRMSFSLLFVDFAIYRCLRVDLEHFEYSAVSLSLPFCMHIQPLDRRDTLLQRHGGGTHRQKFWIYHGHTVAPGRTGRSLADFRSKGVQLFLEHD